MTADKTTDPMDLQAFIDKLPAFDMTWPDNVRAAWLNCAGKLLAWCAADPRAQPASAPVVTGDRPLNWARWIVQHVEPHFRDHACKECVPEGRTVFPGGEDFVCAYHEAIAYLQLSDEGRAILARLNGRA
jgi:hypothetical protein